MFRGAYGYLFGARGQRRITGLRLYYWLRMTVILRSGHSLAAFTRLADVRLWVDGKKSFARIERLIRRAQHTIIVQMFIWTDDETGRRLAERLIEAADRGVQVYITKDAVGDIFELAQDFLGTQGSPHACWQRFWNHPRIRVRYGAHHDHAKVYVIDDSVLLLTGMNVGDDYHDAYHDFLVELRGRPFVEQFLALAPPAGGRSNGLQLVMNTDSGKHIRPVLERLLREAQDSITVEHCYLSDPAVIELLIDAAKRGVRVTVIMPGVTDLHHYANMQAIGQLLSVDRRLPLRVFLLHRRMHSKVILVDHDTAFIGSANLMRSSLDDMGEVNVLIRGRKRFLWKLQEALREDILQSRALSTAPSFLWITRWIAWLGL